MTRREQIEAHETQLIMQLLSMDPPQDREELERWQTRRGELFARLAVAGLRLVSPVPAVLEIADESHESGEQHLGSAA